MPSEAEARSKTMRTYAVDLYGASECGGVLELGITATSGERAKEIAQSAYTSAYMVHVNKERTDLLYGARNARQSLD